MRPVEEKGNSGKLHCTVVILILEEVFYTQECNTSRMLKWFVNPAKMFMLYDNVHIYC